MQDQNRPLGDQSAHAVSHECDVVIVLENSLID